jgi:hypothetical protein
MRKNFRDSIRKWREETGWTPPEFSPTDTERRRENLRLVPDRRLSAGSAHTRTRPAHQFCGGGCGAQAKDPGLQHMPEPVQHVHEHCACGCGTHSKAHCGGRHAAQAYPLSLFVNSDATHRIAVGKARARRIKERGW